MVAFCAVLRVTVMTSPPPSATGPEKLMTWVRENSEVFIMLKHWNELPLISTAWKRLRDTPAVVEDRRAFIDSFQALIEPLTNNVQHQQRNKSLNITECTDCSAAVPEPTSPSPAPETIKTEAPLTEDSTLTTETSDFDATTTRDSNQSNGTDMNSSISNFQPVADNNSTNVLQPQGDKNFRILWLFYRFLAEFVSVIRYMITRQTAAFIIRHALTISKKRKNGSGAN